ncbi:MAG: sensor domain-containing diguanylate cyclase [Candidatus Eremiobacteraeota bacterium]|nr:sensor domain-containing diguanylate cyclase [Candidatus Eremiobacteraeota bacterium]
MFDPTILPILQAQTTQLPVGMIVAGALALIFFILFIVFFMLKGKAEKRTGALISIIQASQELGTTESLESVLKIVVQMVKNLFNCGTVVIYLKDDEKPEEIVMRKKAYITPHEEAFQDFNPDVTKSVISNVSQDKKGKLYNDFFNEGKDELIQHAKGLRAMALAPLIFEDKSLGTLVMADNAPGFFSQEQFGLFLLLANQAALAIRNVQLQKETAQLAITDSLSGMFTHGYFQEHLSKKINEAKYADPPHPVSLMILDVDFFKKVNDNYGHPQGDALLKQLGGVIRLHTRPGDVICRYGGDEFTIIMIGTDRIQAVLVAERIRQAVEEYEYVLGSNIVHITISGGVASFPDDAATKKELVDKADTSMYEAKRKGRNKICFASQ